jgi:hypothetical protein
MKNLILAIAFVLIGSTAFASNNNTHAAKTTTLKINTIDGTCTMYFTETFSNGLQISWTETTTAASLSDCAFQAQLRLWQLESM